MKPVITVCLALLSACGGAENSQPAASHPPAASVAGAIPEGRLPVLSLSEAAVQRLALETSSVTQRTIVQVRRRGGRVVVRPGRALVVQAPVVGTLRAAPGTGLLAVGDTVGAGAILFTLLPLLAPDTLAVLAGQAALAQGDLGQAGADLAVATEAESRAEVLLAERAGSQRALDEARAARVGAAARATAARARHDILAQASAEPTAIELMAPIDGVLSALNAAPGQVVAAGAPLFEVLDTSRVWVRVPVFVEEAADVDLDVPARAEGLELQRVSAPPSADAAGATLDLYYTASNTDGRLRPDQNVLVELTLRTAIEERTLPSSALIADAYGGTWVYLQLSTGSYERRRVLVDRVVDGTAVLAQGPAAGAEVVTVGAAELFGTEFFVSK